MRINIYLSTVCPSGGTYILLEYATRLQQKNYDVHCYYNVKPFKFEKTYGFEDAVKNSLLGRTYRQIKAKKIGKDQIQELRNRYPDIKIEFINGTEDSKVLYADVGIVGSWPAAYILQADKKTRKKCYLIQDYEDWDEYGRGKNSYLLDLDRIVISKGINKKIERNLKVGPFPIIHDGIDLKVFVPADQQRSKKDLVCAMLYSTGERKGCDIGFEAFGKLKKEMHNLKLIAYGVYEKPNLDFEFDYCRNAKVKDLVKIYQESDVFIWPTIFEGWGLTPIEAMACGCVVVGSNVASMKEMGNSGYNCLLSDPGDVNGLYLNLKKALMDFDLRERLRKNALETVKQLSWEKSILELEKHFE